jgi:hypothetical protein
MRLLDPSFRRCRDRSRVISRARRWLGALVLLASCCALAPAAAAASARSVAGVTNATTGRPDASSVVGIDVCGTPTAVRAACLASVLGVRGTGSFVHPLLRRPASPNRLGRLRAPHSRAAAAPAVSAAGAPQPGTPAYLQQAYDLAYLSQTGGAGATVAVVDAYDAPHAEADLAAYRSEFSLPPCTTNNGCFTKVDQNGGTSYPTQVIASWETETSLDLDAVSALCPNCHIVLVEANSVNVSDLAAAQAEAATALEAAQPGRGVISDSWAVELTGRANEQAFTSSGPFTFPGITTVAASGDDGYLGSRTNYLPAALGGVTSAGGTTLVPASTSGVQSARGFDEYAWSGTGSGCDWRVSKPAWQNDTGCGGRSYNDLSADGDPNTGMQVYNSDAGGWLVIGGTSEAAPLIAAYYALVGPAAQGPSWAYANAAQLNDPIDGSNGTCSISYICTAGPGYDGPTGVGSISGAVVAGAPGIGGPGPNSSYTQSVSTTAAQLRGGVYPNGVDTTYWWEYGTTTTYGHQTLATDIGSGTAPISVTDALGGLQPATSYHYRLVAQNSFGTEYGYDFTLTTTDETNSSSSAQGPGSTTQPTPTPPTPRTTGAPATAVSTATPPGPTVTGLGVASAGARTATITASVAIGGGAAMYALEFGTTTALGRSATGSLAASSSVLRGTLRNLAPGRTYYVRAVITGPGGSATSATVRFRTSPVTITRLSMRGGKLQAVLRCHGSAPCRARLQVRSGSHLIATGQATIRGNRTATVTLTLSHRQARGVQLFVLSSWNGYPAAVTARL